MSCPDSRTQKSRGVGFKTRELVLEAGPIAIVLRDGDQLTRERFPGFQWIPDESIDEVVNFYCHSKILQ